MKICLGCNQEKSRESFSKNRCKKDGLQNQCKTCVVEYQRFHKTELAEYGRKYRQSHKTEKTESDRVYRQSFAGKESHNRGCQKYRERFPEKRKAQSAVSNAIRDSKLQRSVFCEECGLPAQTHGHHESYEEDKWLDIIWVCSVIQSYTMN